MATANASIPEGNANEDSPAEPAGGPIPIVELLASDRNPPRKCGTGVACSLEFCSVDTNTFILPLMRNECQPVGSELDMAGAANLLGQRLPFTLSGIWLGKLSRGKQTRRVTMASMEFGVLFR